MDGGTALALSVGHLVHVIEKVLIFLASLILLAESHILLVGFLFKNPSTEVLALGLSLPIYFFSTPVVFFLSFPFVILLIFFFGLVISKKRKLPTKRICALFLISALLMVPSFYVIYSAGFYNFPN